MGPPRPWPPHATTGPFPRVAHHDPRVAAPDSWDGTVPGYEFEGRRPRPGRAGRPGGNGVTSGNGATGPRRSPEPPSPAPPADPPPEPRRFKYTPTVSQPLSAPPQAWPDDDPAARPGFEFGDRIRAAAPAGTIPPRPGNPVRAIPPRPRNADFSGPRPYRPRQAGSGRSQPGQGAARAEWARLLRSFLPEPVKRRWSSEFRAGLQFRGWGARVAIPILAMVVFGVAVVVIAGANSGNAGPAPPATSFGFPPATLAGHEFTADASGRGISQTLGRVASDGSEIVAVGSQTGARIPRAQFFVSLDNGHSWTMGTVRAPDGGSPPPGHGAIFVAGGHGAWVALGPGSAWTSPDGRTWTLDPGRGLPLRAGDTIAALRRTADGFIAVGSSAPAGQAAGSTPLVFLSANGTSWQRLETARLRLAAGDGQVLDLNSVATSGKLIMIAGDVVTTTVTGKGKAKRTATVRVGGAWVSSDDGTTWTATASAGAGQGATPAGHGAQLTIAGLTSVGDGFVLFRPATVADKPAVDVYRSADGRTWAFETTLGTAAGFTPGMLNGGQAGAVITGQAGQALVAFSSANGVTWRRTGSLGSAGAQGVTGVTVAQNGAVVTAATTDAGQDSRQPVLTLVGTGGGVDHVNIAKIPGAVDPQVAVNALAAHDSTQVAVGSANGFPAAWASANGGASWTRATGATPAVLSRPGSQQLTSVTHGAAGWLAVGGVTANTAEHPVVITSTDGGTWQAVDSERAFGGAGLFTAAAAAGPAGYVIVGYQRVKQAQGGQVAARTVAAAWWSAGPTGWRRAGDASAGALDGPGAARQMLAVTSGQKGFVAVGSHGRQPSAWTSPDGRTWSQADLPLPADSTQAVLQHVASNGATVVAAGAATTAAGQKVPFAATSRDGGRTWTEQALPMPDGPAVVTALTAAGRGFTATGTYGGTPGHQDVVVWTSANGLSWKVAMPTGQGLTGPGIQAITGLTATGGTLAGVGFTASPGGEQPVFWQTPIR